MRSKGDKEPNQRQQECKFVVLKINGKNLTSAKRENEAIGAGIGSEQVKNERPTVESGVWKSKQTCSRGMGTLKGI